MIDFDNAIATIRDNNGFTPNEYDDSYYRVYKTPKGLIQVRISNHGTHLWTWVKNAPINPSKCLANICIVLSANGKHNSTTGVKANKFRGNENNPDEKPYSFEVIQYVYNCTILTPRNAGIINQRIQQIPQNGKYYDPFETNTDKHAGVYKLTPNKPIETIVSQSFVGVGPKEMIPANISSDKARPATKRTYGADYPIEENNKTNENKTMKKNAIRINEAQLKKIIAESVKKVLRESEDFIPQGYKTMSNLGGSEIQISKSGDAARFRYYGGEPTEWMEIEFDEDGVAYVETPNGKELLADYMKY